uniref:Reverse transcriptase domain-containing protein n=1 Tax=Xiphophorus maculatus TaxID=8083 RepID=A0A3B5R8R9_XIPMA
RRGSSFRREAQTSLSSGDGAGSPVSLLLFSLAIKPLAIAIRQSNDIKGILIGTKLYKILLYADILLTLTDPVKPIPGLIDYVNKFGKISGYKVNYVKSEIMPLNACDKGEPAFIKPFRWDPTGLKYLGIRITPRISQLYPENINPMIIHIKDKLVKWKKLPISFLGRVNLIKMIIFPKLIYPVKPKIKTEVLQLLRTSSGWGLPKVENYVLSLHARIISLWATQKHTNLWLEIEESVCKPCHPINMLNKIENSHSLSEITF